MENKSFDENFDSNHSDVAISKSIKLKTFSILKSKSQASSITSYSSSAASFIEIETEEYNNTDTEEMIQDTIYDPSELDFQICAQLIQDAIVGTDIDFIHNKTSLK